MSRTGHPGTPSVSLTRRAALKSLAGGIGLVGGLRTSLAAAQTEGSSRFPKAPPKNGYMEIGGVRIYYEEQGQGIPVVLHPPGVSAAEVTRPGAAKLSRKYRVIAWDRPNVRGRSDVVFKGSSEVDLWADQLDELLRRLDARPAYLVGGSMGVRSHMAAAVRYPDIVRGVYIYLASGNTLWPRLPQNYWATHADVADKGGMEAVIATEYWKDVIRRNPRNRDLLLKTDPKEFSRVMRRWTDFYKKDDIVLEVTEAQARRIDANGTPTRIIAGCDWDSSHTRAHSEMIKNAMPNAEYKDLPTFCDVYKKAKEDVTAWAKQHNEDDHGLPDQNPPYSTPYFEVQSLLDDIDEFIQKTEAKRKG